MAVRSLAQARAQKDAALVVLDSSCWVEYFRDTPRADLFAPAANHPEQLLVPVLILYEVGKKFRRELSADIANAALNVMARGQLVQVDFALAQMAMTYPLPLADSLIYATAQAHGAVLWTQDAHFEGLPGVKYFCKDSE